MYAYIHVLSRITFWQAELIAREWETYTYQLDSRALYMPNVSGDSVGWREFTDGTTLVRVQI